MKFIQRFSNDGQGIFYAICSCFFASILISLVRHLSQDFHVFFIVMVRNFFGLVFFLPQIVRDYQTVLRTKRLKMHIARGVNGLFSMMCWFQAIAAIPLAEAVSISFIIPIITTALAVFFLKEKTKQHTWSACFIGFVGILIILRPGFREFHFAYFYCFISVVLWTISNFLIKSMTKTEKPHTIVAYMSLVMLLVSIPIAFPHLKPIDFESLLYFIALGAVSNLTHICISNSYAKSDLSTVQPFDFTRLIFTAIISYFFFQEIVDCFVIIGSLVILSGTILAMPKRKKSQQKLEPVDF